MIVPISPINEELRLRALRSLHILDTDPESEFDEITSLAAYLCDAEISLICLVDEKRQWFKSTYGISIKETHRDESICSIAITTPQEPTIIDDIHTDQRLKERKKTSEEESIVFYAGIPLITMDGYAIGTLCVMDSKPKTFTNRQLQSLKSLAHQALILFELNKKNKDLNKVQDVLQKQNESLKEFARIISHDLKMPLANVITTSDLLKLKLDDLLDEESKEYFGYIKESSFSMSDYINDILTHYESDSLLKLHFEVFNLNILLKEIATLLTIEHKVDFEYPTSDMLLDTNKSALKQVFFNLIGNGIKYNNKKDIKIFITADEDDVFYHFTVTDNGMGIAKDNWESIFGLFSTADVTDKNGNKGHGIGLSTVKKIIENLEGTIHVTSVLGERTTFHFSIKK